MPATILYIFKMVIYSAIFLGYYWIALRNKRYHQYNRFYLLATVLFSAVLPLVQFGIWPAAYQGDIGAIRLLNVVSSGNEYLENITVTSHSTQITTLQVLQFCYAFISLLLLSYLVAGLLKIKKIYADSEQILVRNVRVVQTVAAGTPFSFLNCIFWNSCIDMNSETGRQVFKHELAHVEQKHTYDKLLINIVLVLFWCNPFYWLLRKELNMLHEFIADRHAVENADTRAFSNMILQAAYPAQNFNLINSFFYSPIKRRLIMITKNKNLKSSYVTRILVIPVLLASIALFSFKKQANSTDFFSAKPLTVVINAGHGGNDAGAKSISGDVNEKDLALAIAQKIKAVNSNSQLRLIFTREDDRYQSPKEIAIFTNAQNPDLFVSIHLGMDDKMDSKKSGMNVYVAKDNYSNAGKSKLFASAIINQFAGGYPLPVSPNPMQREQGVWVLQEVKCPSVLIEAGYLSNENDISYLRTKAAKEDIARNILTAIEKYVAALNGKSKIVTVDEKNSAGTSSNDLLVTIDRVEGPGPLYILDGKESDSLAIKKVSPQSIERIDVLKNEQAVSKYGERAKEGVIIITTKKAATTAPAQEQDAAPGTADEEKIFTKVENEPAFPGGSDGWRKYLSAHVDGGMPLKEGWKPGKYTVVVEFIVDTDGNISEVKTTNYKGTKTAAHCIDLVQKGPKWEPAMQNNHAVKAYRKQPITFVVE